MGAQDGFLQCPPIGCNTCVCAKASCGHGSSVCGGGMRYVQPPRPKSFKPELKYKKPTVPIDANTIYKNSYFENDPNEIKMCRMKPYLPINSIECSPCKIDDNTITALSYPGHSKIRKLDAIYPHKRSMLGTGPMQSYTTHKHDFVEKPLCKRNPILPNEHIKCNDVPMENETVQKLSFMPHDFKNLSMATSCRPFYVYKRADIPMEADTIQKLSYLPVTLSPKEELPWAKKNPIPFPDVPFERGTTYKLSYLPNGAEPRSKPLKTMDNANIVTNSAEFEDATVYKGSYFGPNGYYKRAPILPILTLQKSDAKIDPNSVYNLSYPGHSDVLKRDPIWPHSRYLLGSGPLDDMTTQKHDYVDKPWCRRDLILPQGRMEKSEAPFEKTTTTQLSYMKPKYVQPSVSCRPKGGLIQCNVPLDDKTIQKLSYQPVATPVKEEYPWAVRKIHNSDKPMDFNTTQCLSFLPPGECVESACSCSFPEQCMTRCMTDTKVNYPKADCYDVCTH